MATTYERPDNYIDHPLPQRIVSWIDEGGWPRSTVVLVNDPNCELELVAFRAFAKVLAGRDSDIGKVYPV